MRAYVGDEKNMWKPMPGFFVPGSPYYNDEGGRWLVTPPQIVSVVQSAVTLVAFARAFALRKSAAISRRLAVASPGAPRGNQNAFKHGCYTIEATANRREIAALLRSMKALGKATD